MRWLRTLLLALLTVSASAAPAAAPDRYTEGQVWEYHTRPQDAGSLIKIQRIEDDAKMGRIYHINIVGLTFPGVAANQGMIMHSPVSRQTLDASVTRLSDVKRDWPDADGGIAEWKSAKGGVFTIGIADIVAMIEMMMSQGATKSGDTT